MQRQPIRLYQGGAMGQKVGNTPTFHMKEQV
jgi:hypothetical protein